MIAYLDTHVAVWLGAGLIRRISPRALKAIQRYELLLPPMALLEMEYVHDVGRSRLHAQDILNKLEHEAGLRLCDLPLSTVAAAALHEKWTRDPFDRLIVANAKANGFAFLISSDVNISQHYARTLW